MRRTRLVGALAALLVLSVVLVPERRAPRAQTAPAPATGAARMVFVGESGGLVALSAADATVLFEIADPAGVRAVAADEPRGRAWAYSPAGTLRAYRLDGAVAVSVAVPAATSTTPVALVAHPEDGSVWLSVGASLQHLDPQGSVLLTLTFGSPIRVLALDPPRSRIFVGTATSLAAYSDAGQVVASVALGGSTLLDAVVEPTSGHVFAALDTALRRYDLTGAIVFNVLLPLSSQRWVARDGAGGVWAATPSLLLRLTGTGTLAVFQSPWSGPGPIVALVADPTDQTAWVGSSSGAVTHVGPTGTFLHQLTLWAELTDLAFIRDLVAPTLSFTAPLDGAALNTATPRLELSYSDLGAGVDPVTLALTADGAALAVTCTPTTTSATCTPTTALADGAHALAATVKDKAGNMSAPAQVSVTIDTVAPVVTLSAPAEGLLTNQASQTVTGSVSEAATLILRLNGTAVQTLALSFTNTFTSAPITLVEGRNVLEVVALDAAGKQGLASRTVTLDTAPPAAVAATALSVGAVTNGQVTVSGAAGSVEAGARVTITNRRTLQAVTVVAAADGSFTATILVQAGDPLAITATDGAGNTSGATTVLTGPPDPVTVAPALDLTAVTDLASATAFLYTGPNPIQTGVAPGTIEPKRAAVLRGTVKTRDGAALPGVTITVLGHPEFGQTLSRADGAFDLAVNGGGVLTVQYAKAGFLPAQRHIQTPWQDFAWLPEVVLIPLDSQVTVVDLTAPTLQLAQGSPVTDADGTRRATLLFLPGTTAAMVRPDGTTQALTRLSVRATEYTVGPNGPKAMPAELPPASGYTYAVEYSVDEALAAGATAVRFSQPVLQYVENFLNFPVGMAVPVGSYDRAQAAWIPSKNGRVIKVLGITNGLADLDLTGSGVAADATAVAALGVTDAERQQLATRYAVGQSLWRVAVGHFSTWDSNWGFGCARGPTVACFAPTLQLPVPQPEGCPAEQRRSLIECQNQVLGETFGVTGTPFGLHYRSDRVLGRAAARTLDIPLSGPQLPAGLTRIDLEVRVAGRRVTQSVPALANQTTRFTWDGLDAYGRQRQGVQPVTVRVGYVYPGVYQSPVQLEASFGYTGGGAITGSVARQEVIFWQEHQTALGVWDARAQGLGGWTLEVHHAYDPIGRELYLGTGRRRHAQDLKEVIATVAGTGVAGFSGNGGPATQAQLNVPRGVAVGADGSLYLADAGNRMVRRVAPDGTISTVAGTGAQSLFPNQSATDDAGDGGPATQASFWALINVSVGPDGSLYLVDNYRVRRVGPDGIIRTVACTGRWGFSGDGGPATQADCREVWDVVAAPDGSVYVSDLGNGRVRRVGPDGIITTVASVSSPRGLALGPDGSLYMAAENGSFQIYRLAPDGTLTVVAGTGTFADAGDGSPATQVRLVSPMDVAVAPDGTIYLADIGFERDMVRRVSPDGLLTTVAGTGQEGYGGDEGPARQATLQEPFSIAVGPDGSVSLADQRNQRIRRVGAPLPGFDARDIAIASEDGTELYRFSAAGRHLSTVDTRTGAVLFQFAYEAAGRLTAVTDRAGLVTTIEREGAGTPTAIVAPGGQRTALTLGANGFLASVTNPAGETTPMTSSPEGLLATLTDARGQVARFTYDSLGRLARDDDPVGGFTTLGRTDAGTRYTVQLSTGEGRVSTYHVERLATGGTRRLDTDPSGLRTTLVRGADGRSSATAPDGTVTSLVEGPDPRFGMQAPLPSRLTIATPGGLRSTVTATRTTTLASPGDRLSLQTQTDTLVVNGRAYTRLFDATTRTMTERTPAGRQVVRTLDALGRVVQVQAAGLEPTSFTYDLRGRLATITEGTGVAARVTTLGYDLFDRLVSVADPLNRTVGFAYDLADRVTTQTLPDRNLSMKMRHRVCEFTDAVPPSAWVSGAG